MKKRPYDALVIGGYGHVGLPLGLALADAGLQVALYDMDQARGEAIRRGRMPFLEYDAEPILQRVLGRSLHLADALEAVSRATAVIITIGTPQDEYLNPRLLPMLTLAESLCPFLRNGHQIILRSTVYPGTSQRLHDFFRERGLAVHVAFCPERIAQGYAVRELRRLPQLISGFTPQAVAHATTLFGRLGAPIVELSVKEAELAKLFTNAWRYLQFAIANQFYLIATDQEADFARIHHAMTFGYDRAGQFPTAGFAAGPCLLKDTMQLSALQQNGFLLGHAAMLINEGLPNAIVNALKRDLRSDLRGMRVGILGMAFKADVDDIRDSLSYKLAKILRFHGARVVCSDEYVRHESFVPAATLVETCPVVIVGVPHRAYRTLPVPPQTHLVDLWGVIPQRDQLKTAGVRRSPRRKTTKALQVVG
jgi:UDP-N-acetyl-D-mannosaminuronic acid dehydrogenase